MTIRSAFFATVALIAAVSAGCGRDGASDPAALEDEIVVFAASSLTDAFETLAKAFEMVHPGTAVRLNFASSAALAVQIDEGAPADVFASADLAQMQGLARRGRVGPSEVFATNFAVVVAPRDGGTVRSFEDLVEPGLRLVLAAKEVPIGRYAREILLAAGADFSARALANLKSEEANVRAVLTKVELGEADAGFVYATDAAAAAGKVRTIAIPAAYQRVATYPVAVVSDAKHPNAAAAWVAFMLSTGQSLLRAAGFGPPL